MSRKAIIYPTLAALAKRLGISRVALSARMKKPAEENVVPPCRYGPEGGIGGRYWAEADVRKWFREHGAEIRTYERIVLSTGEVRRGRLMRKGGDEGGSRN